MERLAYLDNLKFCLIMLVVMHHLAIVIGGISFYLGKPITSFVANYLRQLGYLNKVL